MSSYEDIKIIAEKEMGIEEVKGKFEPEQKKFFDLIWQIVDIDHTIQSELLKSAMTGTVFWFKDFEFDFGWLQFHEDGLWAANYMLNDSKKAIEALESALTFWVRSIKDEFNSKIKVRIRNLPEIKHVNDIGEENIGKLIAIEGLMRARTELKIFSPKAQWLCRKCENVVTKEDGKEPRYCYTCKASRKFAEVKSWDTSYYIFKLQDNSDERGQRALRTQVMWRCASPDYYKKFSIGDRILVIGMVAKFSYIKKFDDGIKNYLIEANNVIHLEDKYKEIEVTEDDEKKIRELLSGKDAIKFWAEEMFSHLFGYAELKEALICQLIGGDKIVGGKHKLKKIRGQIHILLIGDPSTGKSQLLNTIMQIALKARYASGKSTSAVGVTANVIRDDIVQNWVLEAGAFALANNGILALDEFDKINNEDKSALHEGLEHQTLTVNKANIHQTLTTETSLLAAANPKKGRFMLFDDIYSQFDLLPTLVNRFDLVFPFIDIPNPEVDAKIIDTISEAFVGEEDRKEEITDISLFKKYLIMAKRIKIKIPKEIIDKIKQMYLIIRNKIKDNPAGNIPINPRIYESAMRLAIAHAKGSLNQELNEIDVKFAINTIMFSLGQVSTDFLTGEIDVDVIGEGTSAGKRRLEDDVEAYIKSGPNQEVVEKDLMTHFIKDNVTEQQMNRILTYFEQRGDIMHPRFDKIKWISF